MASNFFLDGSMVERNAHHAGFAVRPTHLSGKDDQSGKVGSVFGDGLLHRSSPSPVPHIGLVSERTGGARCGSWFPEEENHQHHRRQEKEAGDGSGFHAVRGWV